MARALAKFRVCRISRLNPVLIALLITLLQRRPGYDFVGSLREIIGGYGNSISYGGSDFNVYSPIILRSVLSLSLHRKHVFPSLHVHCTST